MYIYTHIYIYIYIYIKAFYCSVSRYEYFPSTLILNLLKLPVNRNLSGGGLRFFSVL